VVSAMQSLILNDRMPPECSLKNDSGCTLR
jgi:hypothetical protein